MANVKIKDNHLTYNGKRYFRGGAEDVMLGSWGKKRTPVSSMNYLEVYGRLKPSKLKGVKATPVQINWSGTSTSSITANLNARNVFGVDASTAVQKLRNEELVLVKFSVPMQRMKNALNASNTVRGNLKDAGARGRVVHQVFAVVDGTITSGMSSNSTVDVNGRRNGIEIAVGGSFGGNNSATVTLAPGCIYAYLLANPKFRRGDVESLRPDQQGQ